MEEVEDSNAVELELEALLADGDDRQMGLHGGENQAGF